MRYDVPRQYSASGKKESRRAWYARLGRSAPKAIVRPCVAHIYDLFWTLSAQRTPGNPIGAQTVAAWSAISCTPIDPFSADAILAMDDAFLSVYYAERDAAHARDAERLNTGGR